MQVKTKTTDLDDYLTDASNISGGFADRLFLPESIKELSVILADAYKAQTPVTISGARTGTVGGAIPFGGCLVSIERMNRIRSIDPTKMTVVVDAGVILRDLQKAVEAEGLYYPPDPTEWSCQIGGTVATNASGARSFKYGATRDFVIALTLVLADGDTVNVRRGEGIVGNGIFTVKTRSGREISFAVPTYDRPDVRKNVSGYFNGSPFDPIDIFIGSEGTLGVIAEIELRLVEKPKGNFTGIVFFENDNDLLSFVDEVRTRSFIARSEADRETMLDATLLEYFDANALRLIAERSADVPPGMSGAIYFEQEVTDETEEVLLGEWSELLEKFNADLENSWFATNDQDRERMRQLRHALPVAVNERIVRNDRRKVGTDMAVPDDKFRSFLRFYKEILDDSGLEYVIFGHIGDCHLHANMIPRNDDEAERAGHIYGRCIAQAIMSGGTVSAEHGIGKLKRHYLSAMMGERYLNEMAELKRNFDPMGLIGRGNMFDESYLSTAK